ncbi:uncharacterized protein LOC108676651 [Hyalella azteca]|uniref:Uncharacterized protein LOC108676651 n=1 Tax=Hyalella azteca TaxID=294128 RepID=A0A8B7P595_HYAAZ|nr:uncharacterized protein LOC108676651 [Hyalella azteca]
MGRKYKKVAKPYNEATMMQACQEIEEGASLRVTAAKYNIGYGKMQRTVRLHRMDSKAEDHRGKKLVLSREIEMTILNCIKGMEQMGMSPPITELQNILQDWLVANQYVTSFKDNRPGLDWVYSFLKRHGLCLKKGGQMQLARKTVTSDPFIIYGFYDLLEKVINDLGIANRPQCIYNLDETCFPTDPSKTKTIGTKGVKTVRVTHGSNRENTTVLATACADGTALDPLIVFKGKRMQTTWVGDQALPLTQYAVTDSGWMTSSVFEDFFCQFVKTTQNTCPILLIVDGHISHTSLATVELAAENNITILKLPPHCTDVLQPLDVACFAPLKSYYDKKLLEFTQGTGGREPLRKDRFVNMLSSVWRTGLSEKNIVAGFRATGIHPLDKSRYVTSRLDKVKLKMYHAWVEAGKKKDENGHPVLHPTDAEESIELSEIENDASTAEEQNEAFAASALATTATKSTGQVTHGLAMPKASTPVTPEMSDPGCSFWQTSCPDLRVVLKDIPSKALIEEVIQRDTSWKSLFNILSSKVSEMNTERIMPTPSHSLEAVLQARGQPAGPAQKKRKVVQMDAIVISDEKCRQQMAAMAAAKNKVKKQCIVEKQKQPVAAKRLTQKDISDDSDTSCDSSIEMNMINNSDNLMPANLIQTKGTNEETMENITNDEMTDNQSGIRIDDDAVGKYVAVLYTDPKTTYFWGKITKVFSNDENSNVTDIEVDFLQKKTITSDPSSWTWDNKRQKEIQIISIEYVLFGPVCPNFKNKFFQFPDVEATAILQKIKEKRLHQD